MGSVKWKMEWRGRRTLVAEWLSTKTFRRISSMWGGRAAEEEDGEEEGAEVVVAALAPGVPPFLSAIMVSGGGFSCAQLQLQENDVHSMQQASDTLHPSAALCSHATPRD